MPSSSIRELRFSLDESNLFKEVKLTGSLGFTSRERHLGLSIKLIKG